MSKQTPSTVEFTTPATATDETAGKLLRAGMQLFGELGFKATTTRMIAETANANIGSIAYYFGNKKGLYMAIARHIAGRMRERFNLASLPHEPEQIADLSPSEASELLKAVVRNMIRTFIGDDEASGWMMLVIREQAQPTEAFDVLYAETFARVQWLLSRLLGRLMAADPDSTRVILETHTLVGQVVFLLVGRFPLLRRLGKPSGYDAELIAQAEAVVMSHIDAYSLTGGSSR